MQSDPGIARHKSRQHRSDMDMQQIGPMLARFMARYPGVTLHLEATNRRVDVVGEGIDALPDHIHPAVGRLKMQSDPGIARHKSRQHRSDMDRRVDVVGEGIDVAIRVRPRPIEDSDLVMRVLADPVSCHLC
jgi:DNA-binding transcriptional LysR family regulator